MSNSSLLCSSCCPTSSGACASVPGHTVVSHASIVPLSHMHTHTHAHSDDPGQAGTLAAAVRTDHRTCARASRTACKPACVDYGACSRLLPLPCACNRACFRLRGCQRLGGKCTRWGVSLARKRLRQPWLPSGSHLASGGMCVASRVYSTASVRSSTV